MILGINAQNHDASMALIDDNCIVWAAHAERYSRKKNDQLLNSTMINELLQYGTPTKIVWFEKPWRKNFRRLYAGQSPWVVNPQDQLKLVGLDSLPVEYVGHHQSHAAAGFYSLVAGAASASKFYLYNSPIDFSVPFDMNPLSTAPVSNAAAAFKSKTTTAATEGVNGVIYRSVNSTYRGQVLTAGSDATTKANADAMLVKIKTAVESKGEKLRYDTAVYTVFRDAALATTLVSDAIADGAPGQNLVPYVYFTNEQDASGNYHPFMIVVNYGNPASPHGLLDIPR